MKDIFKIILSILLLASIILFEFFEDIEWVSSIYKMLSVIYGLFICLIGGYLIFRSIKPKMKPSEIMEEDIKDIKQDWYGWSKGQEPSVEYVYMKSCEFERYRIYTKIGVFVVGLIIVCFGIGLMFEIL